MPTKQQTTSSQQQTAQQSGSSQGGFQNIFDPASMARYQQAAGTGLAGWLDFANNPLQSMFFQNMLGQGQKQIGLQGQSNMQNFLQNLRTAGLSGSSPFAIAQTAQMGRFNTGQQSNLFGNLLQQGIQTRMQALNNLQGFNPLQTGGTQQQSYTGKQSGQQTGQQTQQISGLGTWLPQLIQGGLGLASGGLFGGGKAGSISPMSAGLNNMSGLGGSGDAGTMNFPNVFTGYQTPSWMGGPANTGRGPQLGNPFLQ